MKSTDNIISIGTKQSKPEVKNGKRVSDKEESRRMGNVIRKYRAIAKLEQKQVAAALGYSTTAIGNWEQGLTRPNFEALGPLCNFLNIPIDEFLGVKAETTLSAEDKQLLQNYHRLTPYNRDTVDYLMQRVLYQQEDDEKAQIRERFTSITYYEASVAAGVGGTLPDYELKRNVFVQSDKIPNQADCIIRVNGASMKPRYPDGCRVYVATGENVGFGDVGIFIVNDESYIKEMCKEGLHSYNPCYKTIRIDEGTDCRCFGKVVGIVEDGDIPPQSEQNKILAAFEADE